MLSEIKADVEKQLELVLAASKHEENDGAGADRKTLDSAKADLDSAISKLRTIESLSLVSNNTELMINHSLLG